MLEILLIRPGSTDYDEQGRIQGTLDIPLSERGNREVARLIGGLRDRPVEVVYMSTCTPAAQTAEAVANALGVKFKKLTDMQNLNHGLWQGMLVEEVKRKQPKVYRQWQEQPASVHPPEGETIAAAQARVATAMSKLTKKHKKGVIAVVVPEPLASLVAQHFRRDELGDLWKASLEHGQMETIVVGEPSPVETR